MEFSSLKRTIFYLLLVGITFSQNTGQVSGSVYCTDSRLPLIAVNVYLKNTVIGTSTNEDGYYIIENVPSGKYEIIVDIIGYSKPNMKIIEIKQSENINLNFHLHPEVISYNDDVTVTATRGHSLITEVPSSVNIVNQEEIELRNPQNLAEALQNVPGVTIKDYGGLGNTKSISLRGSSDSQVLVLLDGQRLNNPQSGSVDLNQISLEGIEKIEVVRGGNSALYGSDAIGGVINLISKKHNKNKSPVQSEVKIGTGSFELYTFEPSINIKLGDSRISTSYKYLSSKGNFPYTDNYGEIAKRVNSDIESNNLYIGITKDFGDPHYQRNISINYKHFNSEQGAPGTIEPYYYNARIWNRNNKLSAVLAGKIFNLYNSARLQSYYFDSWYKYHNDETAGAILSRYKTRSIGNELQFASILGPNTTFTYGGGLRYDYNKDLIIKNENEQTTYYVFVVNESVFSLEKYIKTISFVPSLRFDTDSKYSNNIVSPKIGAIFNIGDTWQSSVKFNIGKSYRAPTFNDLYWPEDAWTIGNPDLEPEYGTDWDAGIRLQLPFMNGIYIESSYFESKMTNLIIWQQIEKWMPLNVDKNRNRGVENNIKITPIKDLLDITANYMYLDARNLSDSPSTYNKILVYRPKHTVNVSLTLNKKPFRVNYQFNYTSRRFSDASNTIGNILKPYNTSNVTFVYEVELKKVSTNISFQIKNILDHEYRVIKNMPVPGREYRMSLKIKK